MHVLFFINSKLNLNKLGGIETLNLCLTEYLAKITKKKYKIYLASICKKKILKNNVKHLPIKLLKKKNLYNFDIIIGSNDVSLFKIYKSAKKILWLHNILQIEKSIRKNIFFPINFYRPEVVFVSKYLKNKTSNFYLFKKKNIIPNFLSNQFKLKKKNYNRKKIFVWSVQRNKGLNETISTWIKNVYPLNRSAKLYILGIEKAPYSSKIRYFKSKNIYFFGWISKKRLKHIYSTSMGMICLGYDETFCLNALEANSCGLPIITFGKTALDNYSINNYNSLIVKNYSDLALKINYMISLKKSSLKRLSINSINHSKKFYLDKIGKKWLNLIET
tara:strand:+ start:17404 stop:18399 length:996 start_codon:yes stop_codon:yes gene_type:complete